MNRATQRKVPVPPAIQHAHTPGIMVGTPSPRVPMVHSALNDFDMAAENLWQVIRDLESKLECVMMPAGGAEQASNNQLSPTRPLVVERITGMVSTVNQAADNLRTILDRLEV